MNSRTSVTSTSTAVASPMPVILITGSGSVAKPRKTAIMIAARGGDDLARAGRGGRDRGAVVGVAAPFLADAREQEHVVVRREPEQDREHEQRHVRDDGLLLDAEQARAGRGLERERHDAVGGRDRGQVEDGRQQRDPPGPERGEQEQQRQADDRGGEQRDAGGDLVRLVAVAGGPAADVRRSRRCRSARPGSRRSRSRSTSARVRSSCGPWRGVTVITAVSRAWLSVGPATSRPRGRPRAARVSRVAAASRRAGRAARRRRRAAR